MFTDGLLDTLAPVLALLAVVAGLDAHRRAGRTVGIKSRLRRRKKRIGRSLDAAALCIFVPIYWMLLSGAWLLALVAAAIGGIIAALVAWDPWPLGIVLVAGSLLGWLATLVYFCVAAVSGEDAHVEAAIYGVGPAVAIVLAITVMLTW